MPRFELVFRREVIVTDQIRRVIEAENGEAAEALGETMASEFDACCPDDATAICHNTDRSWSVRSAEETELELDDDDAADCDGTVPTFVGSADFDTPQDDPNWSITVVDAPWNGYRGVWATGDLHVTTPDIYTFPLQASVAARNIARATALSTLAVDEEFDLHFDPAEQDKPEWSIASIFFDADNAYRGVWMVGDKVLASTPLLYDTSAQACSAAKDIARVTADPDIQPDFQQ